MNIHYIIELQKFVLMEPRDGAPIIGYLYQEQQKEDI
jgi:hypothetical protein